MDQRSWYCSTVTGPDSTLVSSLTLHCDWLIVAPHTHTFVRAHTHTHLCSCQRHHQTLRLTSVSVTTAAVTQLSLSCVFRCLSLLTVGQSQSEAVTDGRRRGDKDWGIRKCRILYSWTSRKYRRGRGLILPTMVFSLQTSLLFWEFFIAIKTQNCANVL